MKQVIPVYLHATPNNWDTTGKEPYRFSVWPCDMSSTGEIPLGVSSVEFDILTVDQIVARHAVMLRAKITEVHLEASNKVADLREQLSKLESLTYEPRKE